METRTGNGPQKDSVMEPRQTWVGVGYVVFDKLTAVPGTSVLQMMATSRTKRTVAGGEEWICPQIWFDKDYKCIRIGDRCYDLSRVHYWHFAPPAKEEKDMTDNLDKYTVGRRIIIR